MTDLPVLILPSAERDILAAAREYEGCLVHRGQQLVSQVEEAIQRIRRHLRSFRALDKQYRRALVNEFPYAIAYRVLADHIEILAVFPSRVERRRFTDRLSTSPE